MLELVTQNEKINQEFSSKLDEIARLGAKKLLINALEIEVDEYIQKHKKYRDNNGHAMVVRNGKSKSRNLTLGCGKIDVKAPRVNDKREGQIFTSNILPKYLRKSPNIESLVPVLYLKGLSTNDFKTALESILGEGVSGFSSATIVSLKKQWEREFDDWRKRIISEDYVYIWADGVNVNIRLGEDKKLCLLVVIGVTDKGKKKLLAVEPGYRESKQSWKILIESLLSRGMNCPSLAIADGALGFWSAISEIEAFASIKKQRCWVHKIANVLDKLPKRLQPQAKQLLHDMMNAESKKSAEKVRDQFHRVFKDKYEKATCCLEKDWENLITFFNYPALHWRNIRTTNPIESAFATVKLRTRSTKGAGSTKSAQSMAFKLLKEAEKKWKTLNGKVDLTNIKNGVEYIDGIMITDHQNQEHAVS